MNRAYTEVATRIRDTLVDLERLSQRVMTFDAKALQTSDEAYWDALALNVQSFYMGVERTLEMIVRLMGEALPTGAEWHRELLAQAVTVVPTVRPPIISPETQHALDEYRRFRHVVRNLYPFNLRPQRLHELANQLRACLDAVTADFNTFAEFLEQLDQPD
jgi:hypothetical protein